MTDETLKRANQLKSNIGQIETALCQLRRNYIDVSNLPQHIIDGIRDVLELNLTETKRELEKL